MQLRSGQPKTGFTRTAPTEALEGCSASTKRCEFWTRGEDFLRPACCTAHLLELAVFTHDLLGRHNILHWLDYGSLLGAVRAGELIPWDSDVDFGCLHKDREAIAALASEISAAGHTLDTDDPLVFRICLSDVNRQHVDIFMWDEADDLIDIHAGAGFDWPGMSERRAFPRSYLESLEIVHLDGHPLPAPSPVHEFLSEYRFGPDYMTPMRGVGNMSLVPEITPDEWTPAVRDLLEELGRAERRLIEVEASQPHGSKLHQRWLRAGRPRATRSAVDKVARDLVGASDRGGPKVEELLKSIAFERQLAFELSHPSPAVSVRRLGRAVARVGLRLARKLGRHGG